MEQGRKRKLLLLAILAGLCILFSLGSEYFLKVDNLLSILREASTIGIMALGMTFVIITAGIDLSVGSVVAFCAMVTLNLFEYTDLPVVAVVPIIALIATCIGMLNGLGVTKLHLPDFIVTLASMVIFRGLTVVIAIKDANGNIRNINIASKAFASIAGSAIGPIYNIIFVFALLAVIAHLLLKYTRTGTYVYAIGAHRRAAELSGIDVDRAKIFAYAFSGLMVGIAAIFICSRIRSATAELADGIEMDVIAAVIVGGALFAGGKGDIGGTALGAVFLATLQNGIYKFDISSAYQPIILGSVIIVSIMLDQLSGRLRKRVAGRALAQ